MNYTAHYERLIARARNRLLAGYRERHHVIPRSMGGSDDDDNIVYLTAEEHFVAHQLLLKMNPSNRKLLAAAVLMGRNNKVYGWLKRRLSDSMRGNTRTLGKKLPSRSQEHRKRIAAANRGKKLSSEHRALLSRIRKERGISQENRDKLNAAIRESTYVRTTEHAEKIAAKLRGRKLPPRSEAYRAKIQQSLRAYWAKKKAEACLASA